MAAAFVQSASGGPTAGSLTVTATLVGVTAGNLIIALAHCQNSLTTFTNFTDDKGNTWNTVDDLTNAGGSRLTDGYAMNVAGGTVVVTATYNSTAGNKTLMLHEVSGVATTGAKDQNAMNYQAAPGTGVDAVTSGSVTTVEAGEYIFGGTVQPDGTCTGTITAGTGFTPRLAIGCISFELDKTEDRVQVSAGAIAATFTVSTNIDRHTAIMTFKAAAAPQIAGTSVTRTFA